MVKVEFLLALLDLLDHEQDLQSGELLLAAVGDVDGRFEVGVVDRGVDPVPPTTLRLKREYSCSRVSSRPYAYLRRRSDSLRHQ